jgi:hypothetical protein
LSNVQSLCALVPSASNASSKPRLIHSAFFIFFLSIG